MVVDVANTAVFASSSSPDLATSDFYLFGPMKEVLRGKHYARDEEVKTVVKDWLHQQPAEFYEAEIHGFICRWDTDIERGGDIST